MDSTSFPATNKEKKKKKGGGPGVKLSTDPQSVAARQRRHRISDRFKVLRSLVPGGSKLDTVSMLEEAIQYVKFLKAQIRLHQAMIGGLVDDGYGDDHDPALNLPANNCYVVPFYYHDQGVELCDYHHSVDQVQVIKSEWGPDI